MATVYKIELVSHWISYSKEQLQELLEKAIETNKDLNMYGNKITIEVQEKK